MNKKTMKMIIASGIIVIAVTISAGINNTDLKCRVELRLIL